ncbi:MAG: PAS domain-containing sensor histidine kinase [candidate division WOR-3 bacterium]
MQEINLPDFLGLDLAELLNCIGQGILIQDRNGKFIFANQKLLTMLGYSLTELLEKNWQDIVPSEEWRTIKQFKTKTKTEPNEYETVIVSKSGRKNPVVVSVCPLQQANRHQGTIFTLTDIAERKAAEHQIKSKSERLELLNRALNLQRKKLIELTEQLEKANQELKRLSEAKSDFVSAVSHDLRTPLTTIIEGISLVEDGTLGEVNEEQKKFLRLAIEDAERLNDFINDILDLAKIEAGKLVAKKTKVKPKEQIERLRMSYEPLAHERGLKLLFDLPEPEIAIFCDPGHYYRVVTNFLSNAIKFTPVGGEITIRVCSQPGNMVLTSVKDTGIGIPPEQRHLIFKKFEQVERQKNQPGSGLGLSLCKQLVELNNGKIGFESEVNKGSNFYFTLPVYDELDDFAYSLETIEQQAKVIAGHVVVFLFRVEETLAATNLETTLKRISDEIQPKILSYDLLRIFPNHRAVILVSALPEENVQALFAELVETLQGLDVGKITAAFYICPEVLPNPRTLLPILENRRQPIK